MIPTRRAQNRVEADSLVRVVHSEQAAVAQACVLDGGSSQVDRVALPNQLD